MSAPFLPRAVGALSAAARVASAAWDAAASAWGAAGDAPAESSPASDAGLTVPAPWHERDPAILGNRLTPGRLAKIIADRNSGNFAPWVDLGTEFLSGKNPHLLTQLGIRRASVAETTLLVRAGKGSNRQGAERAARDFEALLDRWKARQEYELVLSQVVAAEWWGRSLHELLWTDEVAGYMAPERALWVHPRRLSYACPLDDPEPWTIRIHDQDDAGSKFAGPYGVPITRFHRDQFILHETAPLGVHKTGEGLFAGTVWYLLMYEWSWRDLMALIELLGRPAVIGYYAAGGAKAAQTGVGQMKADGARVATADERDALQAVVRQVSGSLRATLADTTRVEPLQHGQKATPLQLEAAQHIEGLLSKAVNGSTGVTDIVAGARAAHETAWKQSLTFWRYDVRRVIGWLQDVARRMVAANPRRYGLSCPTPEVWSPDLEPAAPGAEPGEGADGAAEE